MGEAYGGDGSLGLHSVASTVETWDIQDLTDVGLAFLDSFRGRKGFLPPSISLRRETFSQATTGRDSDVVLLPPPAALLPMNGAVGASCLKQLSSSTTALCWRDMRGS